MTSDFAAAPSKQGVASLGADRYRTGLPLYREQDKAADLRLVNDTTIKVSYLELTCTPAPIPAHLGAERIVAEALPIDEYLDLYRRVGEPLRWDQRLSMSRPELMRLLKSSSSRVYVLREGDGQPIGFCEFERCWPEVELKNFGLLPSMQGKGLGSWLLRTALHHEWSFRPRRIWLHTDSWDHPAAIHVYERAGFRVYLAREEPPGQL